MAKFLKFRNTHGLMQLEMPFLKYWTEGDCQTGAQSQWLWEGRMFTIALVDLSMLPDSRWNIFGAPYRFEVGGGPICAKTMAQRQTAHLTPLSINNTQGSHITHPNSIKKGMV